MTKEKFHSRIGLYIFIFSLYVVIFNIIIFIAKKSILITDLNCTIGSLICGISLFISRIKYNKATKYIQVISIFLLGIAIGLFGNSQWSPILLIQLGAFCAAYYNFMHKNRTLTVILLYVIFFIIDLKFYLSDDLKVTIMEASKYASIQSIFVILQVMLFELFPKD